VKIIADTHVHLYPCYNLKTALDQLVQQLQSHDPTAVPVAFLTEVRGCDFYSQLKNNSVDTAPYVITPCPTEDALVITNPTPDTRHPPALRSLGEAGTPSYVFPGQQIVTAERIEILSLTARVDIQDAQPASVVIEKVLAAGGIPVVSWAPGKWFFERGRIVRDLVEHAEPGSLLLGDTTLRPLVWPEPSLMRLGRSRKLTVVAGSDPLPFQGEESFMGSYGSFLNGDFDPDHPVSSIRRILGSLDGVTGTAGTRCGLFSVMNRLIRHHRR
jgi:hypothetical protein